MYMSISGNENILANPKIIGVKSALKWGLLVAFIAAVITIFLPNYYRSEARILPTDTKGSGGLGQLAAAAAAFGVGVPGQDSGDANFVDILNSRSIREDLLKTEFQFRARSWRFGAEKMRQETLYNYLKAKNVDRAVEAVGAILSTSRDLKSKIITISADTLSPELSQQLVQRATKYLEMFVMDKGRTKGTEKARFAEARLKESREEMAQAEDAFRRFLEVNRNYQTSADPSVRLIGNRLEAELKLRQQLVLTISMSREQAFLEAKNDIPIVNILDDANLPIDKSRPKRFIIVILAFFGASIGALGWLNREWIRASLLNSTGEDDVSTVSQKESV